MFSQKSEIGAFNRFIDSISPQPNDCWDWTGTIGSGGYAGFVGNMMAHRWSYQFFNGPIPAGLDVDHICRNRKCVNPDHLEPVTRSENMLRAHRAKRERVAA